MWDAQIRHLAAKQYNRFSRAQLEELGLSPDAIAYRIDSGLFAVVHEGVYALQPVLPHEERGKWMGATLTAPGSCLSLQWAGYAWGFDYRPSGLITVTRPGSGGPRRISGVIAHRSTTVASESTTHLGIPITAPERTLLDRARGASTPMLARCVREAIRLKRTNVADLWAFAAERRRRPKAGRLIRAIARYSGLPLERARSGAEVRALELLRDEGRPAPRLNHKVAGEEADLSWPELRLIVEIDGGPFHQDAGEDARKEAVWQGAGWEVRRVPSDDVYERPDLLLAVCPLRVQR